MCESAVIGLVHYPRTPVSPYHDDVPVDTECAENAHSISIHMTVLCLSSGIWKFLEINAGVNLGSTTAIPVVPICQCNDGYRVATVQGMQTCQGQPQLCSYVVRTKIIFSLCACSYCQM